MRKFFKKCLTAAVAGACLLMPISAQVDAAVQRVPIQITNARWYPQYHIAAPAGWVNDPNGFSYFNGEYHFFYQHYPYAAKWGPMHWGHAVSENLVYWRHLPVAIEPDHIYDASGGCFSGSAIEKDGKLYLMYTGHVDLPVITPDGADRIESQNIAISSDGVNFEKYAGNPVIYIPKGEDISASDFRDPKVWEHNGRYYVVVGSRTPTADPNDRNSEGQILLFDSDNLIDWNFMGIMARGEGNQGFMWECPNFGTIDNCDVLILSPQGVHPEGKKFLNVHQSGYFLGKLNYNTGIYTHGDFDILDYGFDFYAPQITQAPDGRTIMIGWLDMWESEFAENGDGWSCMMTVPRELHVRGNKLVSTPVKELESLRLSSKNYNNVSVKKKTALDGISGETGELLVTVDPKSSKGFAIELRSGGREKTVLSYDASSRILKLNRDKSGAALTGEREVKLDSSGKVNLRIFLDRSSIEIFANNGEAVMSTRVYPKSTSTGINFIPQGGEINLERVTFYKLAEGIPQPNVR